MIKLLAYRLYTVNTDIFNKKKDISVYRLPAGSIVEMDLEQVTQRQTVNILLIKQSSILWQVSTVGLLDAELALVFHKQLWDWLKEHPPWWNCGNSTTTTVSG